MYFSRMDSAISQPHASDPLAFAPAAPPVGFAQPGDFANASSGGEGLDAGNFAQNLEAHRVIVSSSRDSVNVGRSVFLTADDREGTADSVERLMGTKAERDSPSSPTRPNSPATTCWTSDPAKTY